MFVFCYVHELFLVKHNGVCFFVCSLLEQNNTQQYIYIYIYTYTYICMHICDFMLLLEFVIFIFVLDSFVPAGREVAPGPRGIKQQEHMLFTIMCYSLVVTYYYYV